MAYIDVLTRSAVTFFLFVIPYKAYGEKAGVTVYIL